MANQTLNWKIRLARGEADFGRLVPFAGNTYPVQITGGAAEAGYVVYVMDEGGRCLAKTEADEDTGAVSIAFNGEGLRDAFEHAPHEVRVFHAYVKDSEGGVVAEGDLALQWQPLWEDVATGAVYTMKGPQGPKGDSVTVVSCEKTGVTQAGANVYTVTFSDGTTATIEAPRGPSGAAGTVDYSTVVRTVSQQLGSDAQAQARTNIGAAAATALSGKVDKVDGKALSSNDLTDALKSLIQNAVQKIYLDGTYHPIDDAEGGVHLILSGKYAPLVGGYVPIELLPGRVSELSEYASFGNFPADGEANRIYVAKDSGKIYRWSGSAYVEISASLALGETAGTAYSGASGKQLAENLALEAARAQGAEQTLSASVASAEATAASAVTTAQQAVETAQGKVAKESGFARNLVVGGGGDEQPALKVNGYVDANEGLDVENASGIYFYTLSGTNKSYHGQIVVGSDGFVHWVATGQSTGRALAFADQLPDLSPYAKKSGLNAVEDGTVVGSGSSASMSVGLVWNDGKWYLKRTTRDIVPFEGNEVLRKSDLPEIPVSSVNGKTGAVVLAASDVGALSKVGNQEVYSAAGSSAAPFCQLRPGIGGFHGQDGDGNKFYMSPTYLRVGTKTFYWPLAESSGTDIATHYNIEYVSGSALKDATVNVVSGGGTFTFPAKRYSIARDFILVVEAQTEAPTVAFDASNVSFVADDDDVFTAEAGKTNVWFFTELGLNTFAIAHKAFSAVVQASAS